MSKKRTSLDSIMTRAVDEKKAGRGSGTRAPSRRPIPANDPASSSRRPI